MTSTTDSMPTAAGAAIREPHGAGRLVVLRNAEQTDGLLSEVEAICEPGPAGVEERSFSGHDVVFEVLEGRLTIESHGSARTLRAGQSLELPAGTPHRISVEPGRRPARFIWQMRPAPSRPDYLDLIFGSGRS